MLLLVGDEEGRQNTSFVRFKATDTLILSVKFLGELVWTMCT